MFGFGGEDTHTETAIIFLGRSFNQNQPVVSKWFVDVGQSVSRGEPIVSLKIGNIETVYRSFFPGQVKSIYCKVGQTISLDDVLGVFMHSANKKTSETFYTT